MTCWTVIGNEQDLKKVTMTTIDDATNHNNGSVSYLIFIYPKTQLTSCLVSINLSLMSRTLSTLRLQSLSISPLIWCKLLTKNLKPSSPISLPARSRSWICFKTCSCWLRHDFTNYNLDCSEWKTTKHIIATITSRLPHHCYVTDRIICFCYITTSTNFMFSFHQSFTDESDAFSSKTAIPQLQSFDLMQTFG